MVPAPSRAPDPREPSLQAAGLPVSRLRLSESSRRSTRRRNVGIVLGRVDTAARLSMGCVYCGEELADSHGPRFSFS